MAEMIEKKRRSSGGKKNCLLIDCGDTIPGSIIGAISNGRAAASLLNVLEYDAWIIGNHDLEFGFNTLLDIAADSSADIMAANLIPERKNNFIKWKLYEKNGIKIAVIGLTSPHIKEWLWGDKVKNFKLVPTIKTMDSVMPDVLKSKPDVLILAIHQGRFSPARLKGFNITKIAKKYPQINIILGGHSHQEVPGEKCGISTWYVESGCHAEKFAVLEVVVDTEKHRVERVDSKLIPVRNQKIISPKFTDSIKEWRRKAEKFAGQIIGSTKSRIRGPEKKALFATMNELFCNSLSETADTKIVFHGAVMESAELAGSITEKHIFEAIPYEDSVCTLKLTPNELKTIILEQIKEKNHGRFQSPYGLQIIIRNNNIVSLKLENGKNLYNNKRYLCAFSSYILAGAGGHFPQLKKIAMMPESKGTDTGILIRDSLRNYIIKNSPLNIKTVNRIKFQKSEK